MKTKIFRVEDTETGNIVFYEGSNIDFAYDEIIANSDRDLDLYEDDERVWCGLTDTIKELRDMYGILERDIEANELEVVETTSEANGYPAFIGKAVIGFKTFEDAEDFATRHGGEVIHLSKRDGWNLWYRGYTALEPYRTSASDYGDDYQLYDSKDLENFYEEEVKPIIADFDSFEDVQKFLDAMKEVYEELQTIGDNQYVVTCQGHYYDTIDKVSMSWYHDTHSYTIGVSL